MNAVTLLAVALARGAREVDGSINGSEFMRVGIPMLGHCAQCGATVGAYNGYPTKTGYVMCASCVEMSEMGFATTAEFETWDKTHG